MEDAPLRVSVTIPNWNGAKFLGPCLDALRHQTRQPDEVVVVDSASSDDSQDVAERGFPGVRWVQLGNRPGIAAAFNACLDHASGDAVALLNNDTVATAEWLRELTAALEREPSAGSVASKVVFLSDRHTINSAGDFYQPNGVPGNRGVWQADSGQFDTDSWVFSAMGAAALYRRTAIDEVGPFDEHLGSYLEDVDWAFRAHLLGWRCRYAARAVIYHHGSATGGGAFASYACGRNFPLVFIKNMPRSLFRRYLPIMVAEQLKLAVTAARHAREPAARARLRGQAAAVAALPDALAWRRRMQRAQSVPDAEIDALLTRQTR